MNKKSKKFARRTLTWGQRYANENKIVLPSEESMSREQMLRHLMHDHGMSEDVVKSLPRVLEDWDRNVNRRWKEDEEYRENHDYDPYFENWKHRRDLYPTDAHWAHAFVDDARGGEWSVDDIRNPNDHEHSPKTSAKSKLPVGYSKGGQFLCLNCAHHHDIIHTGFRPTTKGKIENCLRCGEQDD